MRGELPLRTASATTAVGALVLLYLLWWTTYAQVHFEPRYAPRPPGAAGEVAGTSIRVLSMVAAPRLADQRYGGEPDSAVPGAVWVVAELEAVHAPGVAGLCTLELLGPGGRRWTPQTTTSRTLPSCSSAALSARPSSFETVFLVPERFADRLVGIVLLDPSDPGRAPVVTPPA